VDATPASTPATPRPGLLRSIGVLNVLVGGLLLLAGGWYAWVMVPFLRENTPMRIETTAAQEVADGLKEQLAIDLRAKEQQANSETEKAKLREERKTIEAKKTNITEQVDFAKVNGDLYWASPFFWADVVTGPVLNLLLVFSGLGLLALKGWARKLAIWVAALKVVRLAVLCALLVALVVPGMGRALEALGKSDVGDGLLRTSLGQVNQMLHASVTMSPTEVVQAMSWVGYGFAVVMLGFGSIYPAIVLLVLTRPSARSACAETVA
jgi:hypothetical protein